MVEVEMQKAEIVEYIAGRVAQNSGISVSSLNKDTVLSEVTDSLDSIVLAGEVEDRYAIAINCAERLDTATVGQLADLILAKITPGTHAKAA